MSDARKKAERIAKSADVVGWIEARLVEEHQRELMASDEKARELLIAKGWDVFRIGELWAVGFGGHTKERIRAMGTYAEYDHGPNPSHTVLSAANEFVRMLRAHADRMENDLK